MTRRKLRLQWEETVRQAVTLLVVLASARFLFPGEPGAAAESQAPAAGQAPAGALRQLLPGHFVYSTTNAGRIFSSGVIVTDEGALVFDALDSEATGRAERASIASAIKPPVRWLVSSSFHDPFSKGNLAYGDVFKIGHESYRTGLVDQMKRGNAPAEEQRVRLPSATFRERMTLYFGGKEIQILHFGRGHTVGDSIVFVPQDRIAYLSELFFAEEFPNMAQGYGVSWLRVLDSVEALGAEILVPGHGPIPEDPRQTRAAFHRMRQIFTDARDAVQNEIAKGATEDQTVAAVRLQQYEKLPSYSTQREVVVRRIYKELTGALP
jgi:glyoxylase-like metal-dependent hydrolase (beta-lactamase superfamily II)